MPTQCNAHQQTWWHTLELSETELENVRRVRSRCEPMPPQQRLEELLMNNVERIDEAHPYPTLMLYNDGLTWVERYRTFYITTSILKQKTMPGWFKILKQGIRDNTPLRILNEWTGKCALLRFLCSGTATETALGDGTVGENMTWIYGGFIHVTNRRRTVYLKIIDDL